MTKKERKKEVKKGVENHGKRLPKERKKKRDGETNEIEFVMKKKNRRENKNK